VCECEGSEVTFGVACSATGDETSRYPSRLERAAWLLFLKAKDEPEQINRVFPTLSRIPHPFATSSCAPSQKPGNLDHYLQRIQAHEGVLVPSNYPLAGVMQRLNDV